MTTNVGLERIGVLTCRPRWSLLGSTPPLTSVETADTSGADLSDFADRGWETARVSVTSEEVVCRESIGWQNGVHVSPSSGDRFADLLDELLVRFFSPGGVARRTQHGKHE